MADQYQFNIFIQGVEVWNRWREEHRDVKIDLTNIEINAEDNVEVNYSNINLSNACLKGSSFNRIIFHKANFSNADLSGASLRRAYFYKASFCNADLSRANFYGAHMHMANLENANLSFANLNSSSLVEANLSGIRFDNTLMMHSDLRKSNLCNAVFNKADLRYSFLNETNFSNVKLTEVNLQFANMVEVDIENAILVNCKVYGLSVWNIKGKPITQSGFIITQDEQAKITVDDIQVAQFIHLLLNNQSIRNVIDTITSKAVLILGRFTDERKAILDALHAELRRRDYLPILFDFSGPQNRDITETVSTLAHLAKFIIADITDARSIPQELQAVVPNLPSVPVQPILLASQGEYGMFEHFKRYPWVLTTYYYQDIQEVVSDLSEQILAPLESKVNELTGK